MRCRNGVAKPGMRVAVVVKGWRVLTVRSFWDVAVPCVCLRWSRRRMHRVRLSRSPDGRVGWPCGGRSDGGSKHQRYAGCWSIVAGMVCLYSLVRIGDTNAPVW